MKFPDETGPVLKKLPKELAWALFMATRSPKRVNSEELRQRIIVNDIVSELDEYISGKQ